MEDKSKIQFSCSIIGVEDNSESKICNTKFSKNINLTRHYNEKHCAIDAEVPFLCPCKNPFTRYYNLVRHMDAKHKHKRGTCEEYKAKFSDIKSLYEHIKTIHKSEPLAKRKKKNYPCEIRGKGFTLRRCLNQHIKKLHPDSQPAPLEKDPSQDTVELKDKHSIVVEHEVEETGHDINSIKGVLKPERLTRPSDIMMDLASTATEEVLENVIAQLEDIV